MKFLPEVRFSKDFLNSMKKLELQINDKTLLENLKQEYIESVKKGIVDELTSFYNRRKFNEDLSYLFEQVNYYSNQHLSLIIIDIDDFKSINDNYGHDRGDQVLKWVAKTLKSSLRDRVGYRESHRIYRYGGEEFIVLIPNVDIKTSYIISERIRQTLEYKSDEKITVSIGIANTCDTKCNNPICLLKYADESLYKAKNMGKNRIVINDRHYFEFLDLKTQVNQEIKYNKNTN